jgi:L-alanine-DL-glutamate epimerase-like enolase superfamily enzyme
VSDADAIAAVDAVTVGIDLPAPLLLSTGEIRAREYVVVTVTTADGIRGSSYSLTRGLPIAATVRDALRPQLVGMDSALTAAGWERGFRATPGARTGVVMRAVSLVDVALWDIKGKRAGFPIWTMLGGFRREVPVLLVGGYPRADRSPADVGALAASYLERGYPLVKLARLPEAAQTRQMLEAAAAASAGARTLVVDAGWCWRSPHEALTEVRAWGDVELAWLEDPLPPENVGAGVRLRSASPFPIGIGDDLTDPDLLRRLATDGALDVIRLDVTSIGGITAAAKVVAWAEAAGLPVSTHVYPELHIHLCAAWPGCTYVESFDPDDNPFDPSDRLFRSKLTIENGSVKAPSAPGLGLELDGDFVARHRLD